MTFRNIEAQEISKILGVDFLGENVVISALNLANRMLTGNNLSYIGDKSYIKHLDKDEIVAVLISEDDFKLVDDELKKTKLFFLAHDPEKRFYELHHYLCDNTDFYLSPSDLISTRGENVFIHPTAVIEDGVHIESNVSIGANVVIHKRTIIGNNVTINAGAVIGGQGFQVLYNNDVPYLVKHVGGVKIHDNVSIGANTSISNSLFDGYTEIGSSTKIDDLVFIAHNCKVGENCVLISGAVMAGSSTLEDGVWLAPNSVVINKAKVASEALIGALSLVAWPVGENNKMFGLPAKKIGVTSSRKNKKG